MNRFSQIYEKHRRKLWIAQAVVLLGVGLLLGMSMRGDGSMDQGTSAQEDHSGHAHASAGEEEAKIWTCSMHPQIRQPTPGECPICGMPLVPATTSDAEQDDAEFFVVDSQGIDYLGGAVSFESFSSLGIRDEFAKLHETIKDKTNVRTVLVKVRKLDTILTQHEPDITHVDVIAVDVEGWELNVMRGFSTQKFDPQVVILENLFKSDEYVSYMKSIGYELWRRLEPNDVFVRNDLAPADSMSRKGALGQLMDRLAGRK